jgi:hypothetical protein
MKEVNALKIATTNPITNPTLSATLNEFALCPAASALKYPATR